MGFYLSSVQQLRDCKNCFVSVSSHKKHYTAIDLRVVYLKDDIFNEVGKKLYLFAFVLR